MHCDLYRFPPSPPNSPAIDMARDIVDAVEDVIRTGCVRILSSGGCANALEGAPVLAAMVEKVSVF